MNKFALAALMPLLFVLSCSNASAQETAAKPAQKTAAAKKRVVKKHSKRKGAAAHTTDASLTPRERLVRHVGMRNGRRVVTYQRVARPVLPVVPPVMTAGDIAGLKLTQDPLALQSNVALVIDQSTSQVLFEKNSTVPLPIASITKLMTSVVVVEAQQNMEDVLEVTAEDVDHERNSRSRLRVGSKLSRANMLHIALMSSENRAASALGRSYPGGLPAFVAAMNAKAKALGMNDTHYVDSTGLSSGNVASARDLAKLVIAAHQHPLIRQYSTDTRYVVEPNGHPLQYASSNRLVGNQDWDIGLQKTGYINEAGRCLVMQAKIEGRPIVMVLLDSKGKFSRQADAGRIRKWLVSKPPVAAPSQTAAAGQM